MQTQFRIACHNSAIDSFFEDEISISSEAFASPADQAKAIRLMYRIANPDVYVLDIKGLETIETVSY